MRKNIVRFFPLLILLSAMSVTALCQETISITTYYPAPFGIYQELRSRRMAIGENYVQPNDYCWGATCTNQIAHDTDLIVEGPVGIGTHDLNTNAILEISSTSQGVMPPRMSETQRNTLSLGAADAGLTLYNTDSNQLEYWSGSEWKPVGGAGLGAPDFDSGWLTFNPPDPAYFSWKDNYRWELAFSQFSHTLGSDPDTYLVDTQFIDNKPHVSFGILRHTQFGIGHSCGAIDVGWRNLTATSISLDAVHCPPGPDRVRIRIWDYSN